MENDESGMAEKGGFWNYCGCEVDMGVIQRDECYLQQQWDSLAHHRTGETLAVAATHFDEKQRALASPTFVNYTWLVKFPVMIIFLLADQDRYVRLSILMF